MADVFANGVPLDDGSPYRIDWRQTDWGTASRTPPALEKTFDGVMRVQQIPAAYEARKGKLVGRMSGLVSYWDKQRQLSALAKILTQGPVTLTKGPKVLEDVYFDAPAMMADALKRTPSSLAWEASFVTAKPFWVLNQPLNALPYYDNADPWVAQVIRTTGAPTGGTFVLSFDGEQSATIAYNASASTIQTALRAITRIGSPNVTCTGGPLGTADVTCTFGTPAGGDKLPLVLVPSLNLLSGGSAPSVDIRPGGAIYYDTGIPYDTVPTYSFTTSSSAMVMDNWGTAPTWADASITGTTGTVYVEVIGKLPRTAVTVNEGIKEYHRVQLEPGINQIKIWDSLTGGSVLTGLTVDFGRTRLRYL